MVGPFNHYCGHQASGNSFSSIYWPISHHNSSSYDDNIDDSDHYISSSSNSVDCTLSLATPSTRLSTSDNLITRRRNSVSTFSWDLLHKPPPRTSTTDPLLARRCANCDTTSTPLWRNGPRGPKSLCNACGIRFKKEERRAAAATITAAASAPAVSGLMDPNNGYYNGSSWSHQYVQTTPQFRFMEDKTGSDSGIQFLSWLTHDRQSGVVHDFTH